MVSLPAAGHLNHLPDGFKLGIYIRNIQFTIAAYLNFFFQRAYILVYTVIFGQEIGQLFIQCEDTPQTVAQIAYIAFLYFGKRSFYPCKTGKAIVHEQLVDLVLYQFFRA